jgi:AcrR family transcriptional regulator
VIHARLVEQSSESLMELVGPVMATVVLPYRGRECSASEFARPVPELPALPEPAVSLENDFAGSRERGVPPIAPVRVTERTCAVLAAVGERPGANNRQVAAQAGASEPQVSRLLARLAEHELLENRAGDRGGHAKSWWLTASGAEFLRSGPALANAELAAGRGKVKKSSSARTGRIAPLDVVEYQRVRLLRAAAVAVDEHGYGAVTVAHIAARAKVSRRTFYELFVGREECLLALMRDIEQQIVNALRAAELGGLAWRERVRQGLWTVLRFFDREPVLARFFLVESARGEDRMTAYRAELLERFVAVVAEGGKAGLLGDSAPIVAEGIAGGVVSILSTRLAARGRRGGGTRKDAPARGSLSDLLGELMGLIVIPYSGSAPALAERERPAPAAPAPLALAVPEAGSKRGGRHLALDANPSPGSRLRMTYRTALALEAIAQAPGTSNLGVARHARVNDQGQISKLLSRLERNGLVQNTGRGRRRGAANEWHLTPAGQQVQRGIREHRVQAA